MKTDMNHWYALDFETSGINRYACKIDRVCVCKFDIRTGETLGTEYDFTMRDSGSYPWHKDNTLVPIMASPNPKVAHNAKYELHLMEKRLGIPINGTLHDTMLMVKHWDNTFPAFDLKSIAWWLHGDVYMPLANLREWIHRAGMSGDDPDADQGFDMTTCPSPLVHGYCMHDIHATARIAADIYPLVKDSPAYIIDTEAIRCVASMEDNGMPVDIEFLKRFIKLGGRRISRNMQTAKESLEEAGVEVGSKKPTGDAIRNHLEQLGERRRTKKSGKVDASEPVLRGWKKDDAVRAVLRVRRDQKTVGTYANNMMKASSPCELYGGFHRFHPNMLQSGAITLRFRSQGFYGDNGTVTKGQTQNFPRGPGIRDAIAAPPGFWFAKRDLASIEARLFSAFMEILLGESYFAEQYRKNDSFNVYVLVLRECAGEKDASKKHPLYTPYKHGVLGRLYGSSPKRFAEQLQVDFDLHYTEQECGEIFRGIDRNFPFIRKFQRLVQQIAETQGSILDPYGMDYKIPPDAAYKSVNTLCQGCAGMVLKDWWVRSEKLRVKFGEIDLTINTVHDELDDLISQTRGETDALKRLKAYCDCTKEIDLFGLPIIAEDSGLVASWGQAG